MIVRNLVALPARSILVASQIVTLPSRHAVATQNVIPSILHRLECKLTALGLPTTHTR